MVVLKGASIEGKMDDVVVMNLFGGNIVTELKPNAVQEIDFLGRKARSMGTEIKNMFLPDATLAAIDRAGALLRGLNCHISLVAAQSVPYPLPLERPPVLLGFNKQRLVDIASESPVETTAHLYLCRWRSETLASALKPGTVVVIGGRKRWWPTWEKSLARKLRRTGFTVIFLELPEARRPATND